ncbi:hypothetical protein BCV72DRAFT_224142 [Rhizopus microsporus var. microsporus]|uniref:Uncharacterized protein n=2 Tax=Rhizopus microsporus TaxID=58291 RepID=A0A2G4T5X6_RHIZD|nr:uncharacterized protein RHIMIDRAFT_266005 [Rhizopus microsporus ATCC 52813]ORE08969.1 hypothetical protein BCV72DRAFT_224142 [Rhizopus microsporus var. microsporus]PHZ16399.1 hypothetical protein RHIMIDRAFT_266005 [Rhizopus microsporus ATCC 52813]
MQAKLLTLALFASFFATGLTAPIYGHLTERESAIIKPIIEGLKVEPNNFQAKCVFQSLTRITTAFPEYPIDDLVARLPPRMFHACFDTESPDKPKQC